MNAIPGLHHVTAIATDPQQNLEFYTDVLGLRLVKHTVNFDDPGTYHFYFGDDAGTPGTLLTFFPWPSAMRGTIGTGETSATAFNIPSGSLEYWQHRLQTAFIPVERARDRFGAPVLRFRDPDGMFLEMVEADQPPQKRTPSRWSNVPPEFALDGFHSVTLLVNELAPSAAVLIAMGFEQTTQEENRYRFTAPGNATGNLIDLLLDANLPVGKLGAGSVHHIAFRVRDDDDAQEWREKILAADLHPTLMRDRTYFHSIYFREPGGVLFELATDLPGFAVDEAADHLGESLQLPPWIEAHRPEIEKALPEIQLPHQRIQVSND